MPRQQIEEIADRIRYRIDGCESCPFYEGSTYCPYHGRHFEDPEAKKPQWCRIDGITLEFGG